MKTKSATTIFTIQLQLSFRYVAAVSIPLLLGCSNNRSEHSRKLQEEEVSHPGLTASENRPSSPASPTERMDADREHDARLVRAMERIKNADAKRADELKDCITSFLLSVRHMDREELNQTFGDIKESCLDIKKDASAPAGREAQLTLYLSRFALPLTIATYGSDERPVELRYTCDDVCPDYGKVYLAFVGITAEACRKRDDASVIMTSRNSYLGCSLNDLSRRYQPSRDSGSGPL